MSAQTNLLYSVPAAPEQSALCASGGPSAPDLKKRASPGREACATGAGLDKLAYACLWLFVFATPWSEVRFELDGILLNRWLGLAAFAMTLLRGAVLARGRKMCELHFWMAAFAAWSMASILWSIDRGGTAERVGTYAQLLLLTWIVWVLAESEERIMGLLEAYVLGTSVCSIATLFNLWTGRTVDQLQQGVGYLVGNRYSMEGVNANDLGLMLALSIPISFYLLARRKGGVAGAWAWWIQISLALVALLSTGSRGAALAAVVGLFLAPFAIVRLPAWQRAVAAIACAGVTAAGAFFLPADTWQRFVDLGNEISRGTMTHRTQIWSASEVIFRDHPLLGVGSGAHAIATEGILGEGRAAHNTFFSVLAELGMPGELLLVGTLAAMFWACFRMIGLERKFWLATLAAWCTGACGGTWEYRQVSWLLLSLLAAHAYASATRTDGAPAFRWR